MPEGTLFAKGEKKEVVTEKTQGGEGIFAEKGGAKKAGKPIVKQWWFWTIIGVVVAGAATAIILVAMNSGKADTGGTNKTKKEDTYSWLDDYDDGEDDGYGLVDDDDDYYDDGGDRGYDYGDGSTSSGSMNWREFVAGYEAWADDYVAFLNKYKSNPTGMLSDSRYSTLISESLEWAGKVSDIDTSEMSISEATEFLEAVTRVAEKVTEATSGY